MSVDLSSSLHMSTSYTYQTAHHKKMAFIYCMLKSWSRLGKSTECEEADRTTYM